MRVASETPRPSPLPENICRRRRRRSACSGGESDARCAHCPRNGQPETSRSARAPALRCARAHGRAVASERGRLSERRWPPRPAPPARCSTGEQGPIRCPCRDTYRSSVGRGRGRRDDAWVNDVGGLQRPLACFRLHARVTRGLLLRCVHVCTQSFDRCVAVASLARIVGAGPGPGRWERRWTEQEGWMYQVSLCSAVTAHYELSSRSWLHCIGEDNHIIWLYAFELTHLCGEQYRVIIDTRGTSFWGTFHHGMHASTRCVVSCSAVRVQVCETCSTALGHARRMGGGHAHQSSYCNARRHHKAISTKHTQTLGFPLVSEERKGPSSTTPSYAYPVQSISREQSGPTITTPTR